MKYLKSIPLEHEGVNEVKIPSDAEILGVGYMQRLIWLWVLHSSNGITALRNIEVVKVTGQYVAPLDYILKNPKDVPLADISDNQRREYIGTAINDGKPPYAYHVFELKAYSNLPMAVLLTED